MTEKKKTPGRPAGSSTAERDILIGAVTAFAKHGLHDCSVANILEDASVSRTNFYRFFKNKEQVFERLLEYSLKTVTKELDTAFQEAAKIEEIEDQLLYISSKYIDVCFRAGDLLPVLFQEQYSLPAHRKMREATFERIFRNIGKLLQNAGIEIPDELILQAFLAGMDRVVLVLTQSDLSPEEQKSKALYICQELNKLILFYTQ